MSNTEKQGSGEVGIGGIMVMMALIVAAIVLWVIPALQGPPLEDFHCGYEVYEAVHVKAVDKAAGVYEIRGHLEGNDYLAWRPEHDSKEATVIVHCGSERVWRFPYRGDHVSARRGYEYRRDSIAAEEAHSRKDSARAIERLRELAGDSALP